MLGKLFNFATNVLGSKPAQFLQFVPGLQGLTSAIKLATFLKEIQKATGESNPLKAVTKFFTDPLYDGDAKIIERELGKDRKTIIDIIDFAQKNNIPGSTTFERASVIKLQRLLKGETTDR